MPTNTFEALATTVVSGTSTNTVTFSGLNTSTYKNFVIIGSCRAVGDADSHIGIQINNISTFSYYHTMTHCQSQQTAFGPVPVTSINNDNFMKISQYQMTRNTSSNIVFRSTITNPTGGRTNVLSELYNFNANNNSSSWTHSNGYIPQSLSSVSIRAISANFANTSTFSIYGLI
jgi:hypothetical protein